MREFADLLKEAAGQPPRPLNMAAVRARAKTLGMRRRAGLWLAAILAVLGIGLPTGVGLAPSGDRPTEQRVGEHDGHVQPLPSTPDAIVDLGTSGESNPTGNAGVSTAGGSATPRRAESTGSSGGPISGAGPSTTMGADRDDGECTYAGPIAADCGERDAVACWSAGVSCPTTTTTSTTTTTAPSQRR